MKVSKQREDQREQFGLNKDRSCTDILCLILFAIFVLALFIIAIVGFIHGDIKRLINPTDSQGRICGENNGDGYDYTNQPYLLFFDYIKCLEMGEVIKHTGCPTKQVCVNSCPTANNVLAEWNYQNFVSEGYCVGVNFSDTYSSITANSKCPKYTVQSISIYRQCFPTFLLPSFIGNTSTLVHIANGLSMNISSIQNLASSNGVFGKIETFFFGAMEDIVNTKYDLLVFLATSIAISLIFIMILRWFAGFLVGIAICGLVGSLGFGTYYFLMRYLKLKNSGAEPWPTTLTMNVKSFGDYYNLNLTIGCIMGGLLAILLLIIIGSLKNIRVAVQLLKESSKSLGYVWGLIFWIIIPLVEMILITVFCIAVAAYLQTMGSKKYGNQSAVNITGAISFDCNGTSAGFIKNACNFVKYGNSTYRPYFLAYVLFMWFWLIQYIDGFNICVISGSFSGYYWALEKPKDIPISPVFKSFYVVLRYHLGSVAFGSLIIAIVKFIRAILEFISYKLKSYDNKFARIVLGILKCCFWCLEKFLKFLTQNAYIQMMIYGKNFCVSAKNAFSLIVTNIVGKFIADLFTRIIILLCVLSSTTLTLLISYIWFIPTFPQVLKVQASMGLENRHLNYAVIPIVVVGIIAFLTARIIFEIYSSGVSTLFLCYLDDLEHNDGTPEKPYYMSKDLMKILGKHNKGSKNKANKSD